MSSASLKYNYTLSRLYIRDRFVQHDELKWGLRSIEHFAPWINRIFIVTDSQYPSWIKIDHPKIQWINHSTLFYPGFHSYNSNAIQFALINIPNISRRVILMDDDCIFLNYVTIDDFFDNMNRTRTHADNEVPLLGKKCKKTDSLSTYFTSRYLGYEKLKSIFKKPAPYLNPHVQIPMDMSVLFQLHKDIDVRKIMLQSFRNCEEYQFESLYIGYSYSINSAVILDNSSFINIWNKKMLSILYKAKILPKLVCVNLYDRRYYNNFLPSLLPNKSSFEL